MTERSDCVHARVITPQDNRANEIKISTMTRSSSLTSRRQRYLTATRVDHSPHLQRCLLAQIKVCRLSSGRRNEGRQTGTCTDVALSVLGHLFHVQTYRLLRWISPLRREAASPISPHHLSRDDQCLNGLWFSSWLKDAK